MKIIVQKYGGSSTADIDKIKLIAKQIAGIKKQGYALAVVVSAMGKTTNSLIEMAELLSDDPPKRELDMLLSTGERVAMSLLSIALNKLGVESVSLTGSQSGIITNNKHNDARVIEVRPFRVLDELEMGKVVVVGGFQGVSYTRDITTLGRGGSDTTAVALSAALNAERCEIYSDVDGVYTSDPSLIQTAEHLPEISYQQMQEMSTAGAKVLNAQAVEFAKNSNIAIYARSTFNPGKETIVRMLPKGLPKGVKAIVHEKEIVRIIISKPKLRRNFTWLLKYFEEKQIPLKELNFVNSLNGNIKDKISFVVSYKEVYGWEKITKQLLKKFGEDVVIDFNLSALSLIGDDLNSGNNILNDTLELLKTNNVKCYGVTTTAFRISLLIDRNLLEKSIALCHKKWIEKSKL